MRAYSMDLRVRVLADLDAGSQTRAVAAKFTVSESWVRRLKQRRAATGETAPRPAGHRPRAWAADADRIRAAFADDPEATLAEVKARLGLAFSLAALWRATRALGLTVKKKSPGRPSRTARTSPGTGPSGGPSSPASTRGGWSSSTRPGPAPT